MVQTIKAYKTQKEGNTISMGSITFSFGNKPVTEQSRVDLHVHSKYSNRPSEWFLRRIGAPECYVEPRDIYDRARQRSMDFVTITDHNCIDGALEIADLPNTFISSEITTYFPEDRCKIHCLVFDITEKQFAEIQDARESIYDLQSYLSTNQICHSIAHPLYSINDRLSINHVEKLLLLFNRFEGINGMRHPQAGELVKLIFRNLTPEFIETIADRHGIAPVGDTPWKKVFTGGSDDHSGMYIASAYTCTPKVQSAEEYLAMLANGHHEMAGSAGTSLKLAHSFYQIAYSYYRSRFMLNGRSDLLGSLMGNILEIRNTSKPDGKLKKLAHKAIWPLKKRKLNDIEVMLVEEFQELFGENKTVASSDHATHDQHSFDMACRVSQQLSYAFIRKLFRKIQEGSLIESLQTFASLGPIAFSIAPYIAAFGNQHKDTELLNELTEHFPMARKHNRFHDRRAWVTDTALEPEENKSFAQGMGRIARTRGYDLTLLTCQNNSTTDHQIANKVFTPVGSLDLNGLETDPLSFPPFLEVIEYIERHHFSELIITTPGPMGITALTAGKLLGLEISGIFQFDYPSLIGQKTEDDAVENLSWRYLQWFYSQMKTIFTFDENHLDLLIDNGIPPQRIALLPRKPEADMTLQDWQLALEIFWTKIPLDCPVSMA